MRGRGVSSSSEADRDWVAGIGRMREEMRRVAERRVSRVVSRAIVNKRLLDSDGYLMS